MATHSDQILRYGGSPGIRDEGLLDSALSMPRAKFAGQYLHASMFDMAAAYLFHVVQNHPFFDGNKRTGAALALSFLRANGLRITATQDELYDLVMATAQGQLNKSEIAEFFRRHSS